MKKFFCAVIAALVGVCVFSAACADKNSAAAEHSIQVVWSDGVSGVYFEQDGGRLFPVNGKLSTGSDGDISVSVDVKEGYRQNKPVLKADGEEVEGFTVPATVSRLEISVLPNALITLSLGEGVGYRLDELKRIEEEVGYTSLIGIYLEEGYRKISPPRVNIIVSGAEYNAVSSLSPYGLDEVKLKSDGYHSFYVLRVLENTSVSVTGVTEDSSSPKEYATVKHIAGEGYTLRALEDTNNDGISDVQRVISGETRVLKGTRLNLIICRDGLYTAKDAALFVNGIKAAGTQGEGADYSDPFSNELIYCLTVTEDIEITVTGVRLLGQFTLHIMNADGTQRYRTFCRADSVAEALSQIPGNDDRGNEAYSRWWEANPGADYTFRYWRFEDGVYAEISEDYVPEAYADIYCGFVKDGETPTDPGDRPTVPVQPQKPQIPGDAALPQSLKDALGRVAALSEGELTNKRWVLAWAAYKLYKAGVDIGRQTVFPNADIYDDYMDDILSDYKFPAANNLYVYAYDMLSAGVSQVSVEEQLLSSFINPKTGAKRSWANNEAIIYEVSSYIPGFEPKTSFTINDIDDLNMTIMLILDAIGPGLWTIGYGNAVKNYTVETYRQYVEEHACEEVTANVVKEVYAFIGGIGG